MRTFRRTDVALRGNVHLSEVLQPPKGRLHGRPPVMFQTGVVRVDVPQPVGDQLESARVDGRQFGCILDDQIAETEPSKEVPSHFAHLFKVSDVQPVEVLRPRVVGPHGRGEALADAVQRLLEAGASLAASHFRSVAGE